jgi:carboxypeptidase Taq
MVRPTKEGIDVDTLASYKAHLREIGKLESALSLLHWDQRTGLPPKGQEGRSEVIGALSKRTFELSTSDDLGALLEELASREDLSEEDAASVRVVGRAYRRHKAIPADFYGRFAVAASRSEAAWEKARAASDFAAFRTYLEEMVGFAKQFAEYYGYKDSPYDALVEEYEPGMTSRQLQSIIAPLRDGLVPLIKRLTGEGKAPDTGFLRAPFPAVQQRALSMAALRAIGYDFDAGRLDTTVHPFTIGAGPGDVRVTTRFIEDEPLSGLFSSLHEGGHALYDQGLPESLRWSGLDEGASYGIHESQSRMWENLVCRSRSFWSFFAPHFADAYPAAAGVAPEGLYRAANRVEPSFIRVEADEVTYNLHIMLRFELEQGLISGETAVRDLPELWRDAMRRYLGVVPGDDARGVLQDVHWAGGMFGYFPSYMLGNLYSAQLFATIRKALPDLDAQFARGEFAPLLAWLRENVHRYGRMYEPGELIERVTGEPLNPEYFLGYVTRKFTDVYEL